MPQYIELFGNRIRNIIIAEESYVNSLPNSADYILYDSIPADKQKTIRMGNLYDAENKKFYPPKPTLFNSWVLDEETNDWRPPFPHPEDGKMYVWDETIVNYKEYIPEEEPPSE